jgi:chorismate lyase/3-hydroxybenzoate synthase
MNTTEAVSKPQSYRPSARTRAPLPPTWVGRLFNGSAPADHHSAAAPPFAVSVKEGARFTLVTVRVAGAADMNAADFERCAAESYSSIKQVVHTRPARHPVRFWNYIPDIRRTVDGGRVDQYMVFNAGRFTACSDWFGGPDRFDHLLPTASAVGHEGPDLLVHALAADAPGVGVENPRQVPSYRYSPRFGPRPPCFARATVLTGAPHVLVGGTASILGEESLHPGDVRAQATETFENLSALLYAATGAADLRQFTSLRVYYVRHEDNAVVRQLVRAAVRHLNDVEYVRADLCRPELLIEIEGTA